MRVKTVVDEDFTNYKKPAMFIGTISCGASAVSKLVFLSLFVKMMGGALAPPSRLTMMSSAIGI